MESRQSTAGVLATHRPDPGTQAATDVGAARTGSARSERGGWDPLDELAVRVGSTLDPAITAQEVVDLVVPGFADHASILLRQTVLSGAGAAEPRDGPIRLVRLAFSARDAELAERLRTAWPVEQVIIVSETSPYAKAMRSHEVIIDSMHTLPSAADGSDIGKLMGGRPGVFAPLLVGGRVLGAMVLTRNPARGRFRPVELASIERLAARASIWMDNARLHDQLRHTAISMQKAMLPTKLAAPVGLEIAHRYLPGSDMAVVGGDWFDVIGLSGGRVALVVGDVMGHGTQAASAMGQMRTAVRTLAAVDLPPAEVLAHLDDLMPHIDDSLFATCIYAVYDPAAQQCSISRAGHVPPLVVHPDGRTEVLHQVAPGLPLGLGGATGTFDTLDIDLPDGALFVLCTDGLLENKARDIDSGLNLLRANLAEPGRPLQEICDQVVKELDLTKDRDDIALLISRVHPLPADRSAAWWLPGEPKQVGRCRRLVRDTLAAWELSALTETVELLVSELVTNAIQHAGGEIRLRLQRNETGLLCEVCDRTRTPPELQELSATAERGRGILLVNELSRKWGHRRTATGKIVWFTMNPA
ncbi:MAG TPA: ATP-binding SpoIIE family protein phosphatase [Actinocrinis sp.]|uniref:ATP-binding SpoIIE family protein phosphatase n=2 Tax=Actinocrinis sp. TaxID=1920516 RepID=UPI002DDD54EB|nr:ATP-binding SpoIIE family protein phosphatase [Actinocrinis sp.]HEV2345218.1 ATP-binding SpoIIE family protein phosphatase [Actinocrinis sp.]